MKRILLVCCGSLALAHATPALADETFSLDSYNAANPGYAGPAYTSKPLAPAGYYLVTIQGTFSKWTRQSWTHPGGCGTPESAPMFPSAAPNDTPGPVGVDAETIFAASAGSTACNGAGVPRHKSDLQIDTGNGFGYVAPEGGPYATPTAGHAYTYVLVGAGAASGFGFRYSDYPTNDNYGALQITVHRATKDDCKAGGWRQFGGFRNQGDCVSYMSTNGRNSPNAAGDASNDE